MMLGFLFPILAAASSLNGLWLQDCQSGYQRQEYFYGAAAEYSELNFWDKACTRAAVRTTSRGSIQLGKSVDRPFGATELDFEFSAVSLTPLDEKTTAQYNKRRLCGFSDWAVDGEKEVTGRECDFYGLGSVVKVPSKGDRRFGVVRESLDALFFGRLTPERDGSSKARRPRELDPSPYKRIWFP